MNIKKYFSNLFCSHKKLEFVENIYGDQINIHHRKRSIWKCQRCGKLIYKDELYTNKFKTLDNELRNISNQYYIDKQNKWEDDHRKTLIEIESKCLEMAHQGDFEIDIIVLYDDDDFYHFKTYLEKHNLPIIDDKIDCEDVKIKRHNIRISWWK